MQVAINKAGQSSRELAHRSTSLRPCLTRWQLATKRSSGLAKLMRARHTTISPADEAVSSCNDVSDARQRGRQETNVNALELRVRFQPVRYGDCCGSISAAFPFASNAQCCYRDQNIRRGRQRS